MKREILAECVTVLDAVLTSLAGTASSFVGEQNFQLRNMIGDLQVDGPTLISSGTVGPQIQAVFDQAVSSGATLLGMRRVQSVALTQTPVSLEATLLAQTCVVLALVEESKIIVATEFTSRDDVDLLISQMNDEFGNAEEVAADALDQASYAAIIALHASVTRHLVATARPLPQMVSYEFPDRRPTLWMAQRLYYDGSRADEILLENKIVHPAFSPLTGRVLSA